MPTPEMSAHIELFKAAEEAAVKLIDIYGDNSRVVDDLLAALDKSKEIVNTDYDGA